MWKLSERAERIKAKQRLSQDAFCKARGIEPMLDYELDLQLFSFAPRGNPTKHEFLLRCWNHQWPDFFMLERDGIVNHWHVRMAKAFCEHYAVTLVGCASSGKTFVSAAYSHVLWKSKAFSSSIYLSTTSSEAGEARTWGTIKDLQNRDVYKVGKTINTLRTITLDEEARNDEGEKERDYRNCIKAVLIKSGAEGKNIVGTICGRKNLQVAWICDEMSFLDLGILDARVNLFSNAADGGHSQFIGVGNAPSEGDPLYIDAEPFGPEFPDGWRSVDKDIHEGWTTRTGYCLYFNGDKSPNMRIPKGKPVPFPRLMDEESKAQILKMSGGEDTPVFWKQFYGFPPSADVPDKIVTYKLLESNKSMETPVWFDLKWKTVAGLDLGFRDGGDPTTIDFGRVGTEETGRKILGFSGDAIPLLSRQTSKDAYEAQIARQVIAQCRDRDCHDLALDVTGDGGILLQHIERVAREEKYQLDIIPVSFSGTADDTVLTPGDKRKPTEIYANKVSQIWAQFRVCVINGVIRGCNPHHQAVKELCGRRFATDEKRRFLVEKKSDYKKRLRHSPDKGDARCLCAFMALKLGLSGEVKSEAQKAGEEREKFEEATAPSDYSGHGTVSGYSGW
jgi:hypothetical protein